MRIGAPVFGYKTAGEWVQKHISLGLGAAYWPLSTDADPKVEEEYLKAAQDHGLVVAEVGIWNNLLAREPKERAANVRKAIGQLRLADRVGARCCVNISGSRSDQWDGPHPDNLGDETFGQIVDLTRHILDEAAPQNTYYTLEPMPWAFPHDADSMLRLLKAVDRPRFGVHVDMVNMVNAMDKVYHTGRLTQVFFSGLRGHIRSVHAKDLVLGKGLTLHIDEAIPGQGIFDFDTLLSQCAQLGDVPVMAEHLETEEEYAQAVRFLQSRAEALNLPVEVAGK